MLIEQREGYEVFQAFLWSLYGKIAEGDVLQKIRAKAWEHFLNLGLPTRKNDVYRYVKLRSFFAGNYESSSVSAGVTEALIAPHVLPECRNSVLVFVNGHFSPEFSKLEAWPKRAVALPLAEAMRTYGAFLNNRWGSALKDESDPFAAINGALHQNGLFLYLPPKTIVQAPIQILHVIDSQDASMFIMPRIQAFVGAQSEIGIVSTQAVLSGEKYAFNLVCDMAIEEEAHVRYTQSVQGGNVPWHFDALRATLKRNSTLKTVNATQGGATVRFDYKVVLTGENAEANLNGVWMLAGKNEAHTHVVVDHQAPFCRSMQLFKGALSDISHSAFEGKILVRQAAQKTEAFQLNNNLLLSDRANAESKPNLEIFADDVKASHGSTVGQLDDEQIFYMKTRGFSETAAKNLLVYGFCQEVIDMITISSLHGLLKKQTLGFLSKE